MSCEKTELLCSKSRFKTSLTNKTGLLCSSGFKTSAFFVVFLFSFLRINFSAAKLSVWCTVNNCSQSGHMPTYIIMRHIMGGILPQGSKARLVLLFLVLFLLFSYVCKGERYREPFLSCQKNHVSVVKSLSSWQWQNFNPAFFSSLFSKTMQDANLCHAWLDPEPCLRFLSNQAQTLLVFCFVLFVCICGHDHAQ